MRVTTEKIDGVRETKVSLKDGLATIQFNPSNRVQLTQIWRTIRSNGFAPRSATIRALGTLNQRGDTLIFTIAGSGDGLVLLEDPKQPGELELLKRHPPSSRVVITGELAEAPDRINDRPLTMVLRSFSRLSSP